MPNCPHCGAPATEDDRFCQQCGGPISEAASLDDLIDAGIVCPQCDTYNDALEKVCISCGASLAGMTNFLQAVDTDQAPAPDSATASEPELAPVPEPESAPAPVPEPESAPAPVPEPESAPAPVPEPESAPAPAPEAAPAPETIPEIEATTAPSPATHAFRLRLLSGGGPKDATFPIPDSGVVIGRSRGQIQFGEDPYLAPAHLKLVVKDGQVFAGDGGGRNGTFLRVRSERPVGKGDEFLVGQQRFLLLGVGGPTRDIRTEGEHDARPLGGPVPKELFAAIRQLHAAADGQALAGSVMLRSGPVVSIGKKGCDIEYPRDGNMHTHHAELHLERGSSKLVEVQGPVYLRIKGPTRLEQGDEIRMGEELLRVEQL